MNDNDIIELYWARDERAISETDIKYGRFCRSVAFNILTVNEDAEECVNDTYHKAWTFIPPQRPERFRAWLGKIVRNLALNLWNRNHTQKRNAGMETMLSELEDCVPSRENVEDEIDSKELGQSISRWLGTLSEDDRRYFILRYWNGVPLRTLAERYGISADKLAQKMLRLRKSLRTALEKEEIYL
jgi:RNA polymerase sigma-70 factor (ECF subfamily)